MCTREEGKALRDTFEKYAVERRVDPEDMRLLDVLADARRIEFLYRKDGIYARQVVFR